MQKKDDNIIKIYSDWSCLGNPGPWWYAAMLMYWDNTKIVKWAERQTTNNKMELKALVEWLKVIKTKNFRIKIIWGYII